MSDIDNKTTKKNDETSSNDNNDSPSLAERRLGKKLMVDIPIETMSSARIKTLCSPCDHKAPPVRFLLLKIEEREKKKM
jgi:hypothetical protein